MAVNFNKVVKVKEEAAVKAASELREQKRQAKDATYDHAVVVNGKQKKISKKSAFLLDMLTLDDE